MNSINNLFKLYFKGHNGRPDGWGTALQDSRLIRIMHDIISFHKKQMPNAA